MTQKQPPERIIQWNAPVRNAPYQCCRRHRGQTAWGERGHQQLRVRECCREVKLWMGRSFWKGLTNVLLFYFLFVCERSACKQVQKNNSSKYKIKLHVLLTPCVFSLVCKMSVPLPIDSDLDAVQCSVNYIHNKCRDAALRTWLWTACLGLEFRRP